ncbi:MAG: endolytic transglycosylase MltG [Halomonas sp.]|nr:endolytic transglycosylase MltG [Halomonas sp.]
MRLLKLFLVLLVIAGAALFAAYTYWQSRLDAPVSLEEPTLYEVPRGASFNRVMADLDERGFIADDWPFRLLAVFARDELPPLRAGEFRLEPGMSGRELVELLSSDNVVTYSLTVPEGLTFAEMRDVLNEAPKLTHLTEGLSGQEIMAKLGHPEQHPEGRFFPDTYQYHKGVTDIELLRQAYERMHNELAEVWAARNDGLPFDSAYEALIMASLIERETGFDGERRRIAGVFVRRLEKGMRLQTDPTVIYGLGEDFDGNLTRADLRRPTAYNTYVIDGLPPTPIALPGRAALEAAVNPAEGDALYFVAKGDGSHHFSNTLSEHNAAVRRYILDQ